MNGGIETFDFDGFHFFMLDTRTERSHRSVGSGLANATLFNSDPRDATNTMSRLKKWLLDRPAPKFVVSPAMLLPRHRRAVQRDSHLDPSNVSALHSDGWDGYPKTLHEVLAYIAKEKIEGVVFLSGDEHRGSVATADLCDAAGTLITRVHSVHTAAAYAPYPFANGVSEDIVKNETIDLVDSGGTYHYRCVVKARRRPAGDGMTFLSVHHDGAGWKLDCEFANKRMVKLTL
jgi:cholesterol oxidase